jgi:hypothetical protein
VTDETPIPKRKRRRWIIAGVLLLMMVAVTLWCWPRGDARFVGKWQQGRVLIDMQPNGGGTMSDPRGISWPIRWWVDGKVLCINLLPGGGGLMSYLKSTQRQLSEKLFKGHRSSPDLMRLWIEEVYDNRVHYRQVLLTKKGDLEPFGGTRIDMYRLTD